MAKTVSTRTGKPPLGVGKGRVARVDASIEAKRFGLKKYSPKKMDDKAIDAEARERQRVRGQASTIYKVVGRTFDGVDVLQPKMKSTHFEPGEARRLFKDLLGNDGIERILRDSRAAADKA